ncbi:MAG: sensor histidine kinase, partial [Longimicrobiales bacterium]
SLTFARERGRRRTAERRADAHDARCAGDAEALRRVIPVAAHELRSPISVVLGYQELLAGGLFGKLDEKGVEALARVRRSAEQLLRLVDGIVELAGASTAKSLELVPVDLDDALSEALDSAAAYGLAYGVELETRRDAPLPIVVLDEDRTVRALAMTLAAAIKASPGRRLAVTATPLERGLTLTVAGTGLDAARDDLTAGTEGTPMIHTGAGLRLAIARRALAGDAGTLALRVDPAGVTVELCMRGGPAPIDGVVAGH